MRTGQAVCGVLLGFVCATGTAGADLNDAGKAAYERGDYAAAERLFSQAATQVPHDPLLHYHRGVALMRLSRWREAAAAFETVLRLSPPPDLAATTQEGIRSLAPLLRATGGIPLDRSNPGETVRALLEEAGHDERFLLVLAAEGTREKGRYWKSGFYRIAQQTGLPIALGFVDGPSRTVGFGPTFVPTGDVRADMDRVRAFYADKRGVRPALRTEPRLREEDAVGRE